MIPIRPAIGLIVSAALAAALPPPAGAQTATRLHCRGCVAKRQLGTKSVVTKKIRDGAVTGGKIGNGAVTSAKISDGTVAPADLAAAAKPAGVESVESLDTYPLANVVKSTISATVSAPAAGHIAATATWYFASEAVGNLGQCYLGTVSGGSEGPYAYTYNPVGGSYRDSAALTRVFDVPAGDTTIYLNCYGAPSNGMHVISPSITAMYFPARY
jgi:hypothetical protein